MRASILSAIALFATAVCAKSTAGSMNVVVDGVTYNGANQPKSVSSPKSISIKGRHVTMEIDPKTFAVTNYALTGYPDDLRLVTKPTVVFASKTITLTDAQRAGTKLDKLEIDADKATIIFKCSAGKVKFQINDGAQGGIFQVEVETAAPVEYVHTLGDSLYYFVNEFTGKINGGDGQAAVSKAEDSVNYHKMLLVKDSPQVATKTFQDGKVSKWSVSSGGRMGGVLGEDAVEMGSGATNCVSDCQARNRINGKAPVPSDPTTQSALPVQATRRAIRI